MTSLLIALYIQNITGSLKQIRKQINATYTTSHNIAINPLRKEL